MNIYEKINEIRKAVEYIQKDRDVSVGAGKGGYKAVTHDAVTGILRKHLIEHGVVIVPTLLTSSMEEKKDGAQRLYSATYSFDFINMEAPEDRITIEMEAHAMDSGDKAPGKAISYAKKYAVLKLFEIETGEDEESRYKEAPEIERVSEEQLANIIALAQEVKVDMIAFRKYLGVAELKDIAAKEYVNVIHLLEKRRAPK